MSRSTWRLQLDSVRIKLWCKEEKLGNKGMAWLMERAQSAQELDLQLAASDRVPDIISAVMEAPGGFRSLIALSVNSSSGSEEYGPGHMARIHEAVAWLFGQAHGIQFLSLDDARREMWSDLADRWILRSFTLEARDESIDDEAQLPNWMLRIVRIDTLVLSLKSFGKGCGEHIKLQGALAHVDRLCLECKEGLYVEVPQEQAWSWVNFHSDGELFVGFQSVGFFAETVRLFSFLYGVLQGTGLLSLVQRLLPPG
ncbi:hypothetical protein COCSUDRAFT_57142 [Coccomyxa subellipsoidea C-169]|uniref:Uncharacterized protein n=1 Tax=Coccomyxa subellipsoidea (strain C-169) TaxID=574566 RepID=I0YS66_COCSC|nr:hypothetical protein COCSUDRAFT_57142 [Coccomyxa subellipsoidea C-169]EIE21235.1 hypothetical protein COCSUDRAFT_57142 [Coccomyxa subellipsoidea C-169]|eukprot:XP_005645779.1 hypothetical protein COCSUDRAFT_57142 [Coccomyxa subellipsoidea C-169]